MASPFALLRAGLVERLRSRAALVAAPAGLLALVAAALASAGGAGDPAPVATDATLLVLGVLCAVVAASTAGDLPSRRASGAEEWLATTSPSPRTRRLSVAATGGVAVLATAAVALAAAVAILLASGRTVETRAATPIPLHSAPARLIAATSTPATVLDLEIPAAGAAGSLDLEVDFRPVWRDWDAAGSSRPSLLVGIGDAAPVRADDLPGRGSWRRALPPETRRVRLLAADPKVDVVVTSARVLGERASFAGNLLVAALLLALAAASVVPFAVLLSRGVSAPTAAAAAALVLLVGVYHEPLLSLASDVHAKRAWPAAVLKGAAAISPDLSGLSVVSEAARGRAIPCVDAVAGLWPAFAHAGVCLAGLLLGRRSGA